MHIRIAIAALFLLALGCATPEDGFVGRFSGSYECSGSFDDGSPYTEGPSTQRIAIERATDGSVYLAGTCTIPLDVISPTRAEVVPATCNTMLTDGTPSRTSFVSGLVALDEPRAAYSMQIAVEAQSFTLTATCTFDGTRTE